MRRMSNNPGRARVPARLVLAHFHDVAKRAGTRALPGILAVLILSATAVAESMHDRVQRANGLLRSGEAEKALDEYHQIQVDHPNSPVLEYNIGCAQYEQGLKALQSQKEAESETAFSQAKDSFDRALQSGNDAVRSSATFNRANSLAQTAKLLGDKATPEQKLQTYHDAIHAYEDVLQTDPSNAGAQQNIDHLRYMLKRAMQEPPPQQGEGEQNPQDENQQQDSQDQNQPQPSDPQQQQHQNDSETQPQEQQDQENQPPQPNDAPPESSDAQEQPRDETGQESPQGQTLEALLDSLDEKDKEMQQDLRKAPRKTRIREQAWW